MFVFVCVYCVTYAADTVPTAMGSRGGSPRPDPCNQGPKLDKFEFKYLLKFSMFLLQDKFSIFLLFLLVGGWWVFNMCVWGGAYAPLLACWLHTPQPRPRGPKTQNTLSLPHLYPAPLTPAAAESRSRQVTFFLLSLTWLHVWSMAWHGVT